MTNFFRMMTFEVHCDFCDKSVRIEKTVPWRVIADVVYLKPELAELGWQCMPYDKGRQVNIYTDTAEIHCPEHVCAEPPRDSPKERRHQFLRLLARGWVAVAPAKTA